MAFENEYRIMAERKRREYTEAIHQYITSQHALWQKLPYLALMSMYRKDSEHSTFLKSERRIIYKKGIFLIGSAYFNEVYNLAVDCASGTLVCPTDSHEMLKPDCAVIAETPLEEFDAERVINTLEDDLRSPPDVSMLRKNGYSSFDAFINKNVKKYHLSADKYMRSK